MPLTENFNQDVDGNTTVVGTGVAGTPSGGVVSIQGQTGMTPLTTTGTGAAGTPAAGVSTIQGITGGTPVSVVEAHAASAALTTVTSSNSSTSLLASNANRKGFILYNNSTKKCYVAFSATATTSAFTVLLQPNSLFESQNVYTGPISGIWEAVNGNMQVTELS